MIKLLQAKLEAADNLKNYTKEILSLSPKIDFIELNRMIEYRQKYEEVINLINEKVDKLKSTESYCGDSIIIKDIKDEIAESIKQTIAMDKEIRNKINIELKETKENLNQPEKALKINLKA